MGLATMENLETVVGSFVEKSVGLVHEYSKNDNNFEGWHNAWKVCRHKLWTLDGFRYAIIKKTVAYIATGEDAYGKPIFEKWDIKQHKEF